MGDAKGRRDIREGARPGDEGAGEGPLSADEVSRLRRAIRAASSPFPGAPQPVSGLYVLLDGEEIVYVGISDNIRKRVLSHTGRDDLSFDRGAYVRIEDRDEYLELESALIDQLEPTGNRGHPYRDKRRIYDRLRTCGFTDRLRPIREVFPARERSRT